MPESIVLFDVSRAGASGDMFLSALVDLLGEDQALVPVAASLLIYDPQLRVRVNSRVSESGSGKRIDVSCDRGVRFSPGSLHGMLSTVSEELELSPAAKKIARTALEILLEAEMKAHRTTIENLKLHETGSIDTMLDILGTVYLLERARLIDRAKFMATHVAVGSGQIVTEHGTMQVPVPAVVEILTKHNIPHHPGDAKTEVLTPTGAALIAALVQSYVDSLEGFMIKRQGVGFGARDLGTLPNTMRILIGDIEVPSVESTEVEPRLRAKATGAPVSAAVTAKEAVPETTEPLDAWDTDEVVVIESTVDDVDGEVMGQLFDFLLSEGLAYDVVMIPAYGKKNRPCTIVQVVAPRTGLKTIARLMIHHLGTLGIRYTSWQRLKTFRESMVCRVRIDEREYMVRVKVSRSPDGSVVNIKPEADDVGKISLETGIPLRELRPLILSQVNLVSE
ncbi:MAG: nickel pincer cofactor biosynthesis protein LarC [Candidatus Thorarchaeota archaeon]